MAEPFLGEIRLMGGTTIPGGWAACEGQTLSISQNQALFAIIGTQFGGDGISNFRLPDLRGRVPLGVSPTFSQGTVGGEAAHALSVAELPSHTHTVSASSAGGTIPALVDHYWASAMNFTEDADTQMAPAAIATAGAGAPHENMQPYQAIAFCIAITGIFPPRP
jgi:microcystin-dependent protein